ncbi:MAG: biotin/lipoate A/B protein ligase family protein [Prolixibacteraceae bacterium]
MLCILSPSNEPEFNLAAEEYLFRNFSDDIFFLYVNQASVVVGKHQNALAEINFKYIREHDIRVIRRLSGGGAVYHDLGNLNFSFHQTVADTAKISFKSYNLPIIEVLKQWNVPAEISARNDIFVKGFKISGHAEHVFRNRIMSHGTLLFNANREMLSKSLKHESGSFTGKAIQSVRSKVANIVDFLSETIAMDTFIQKIVVESLASPGINSMYTLSESDIKKIRELAVEKYSTWAWNFGYSPKYRFEKANKEGSVLFAFLVEKGMISEIESVGEGLSELQKKAVQQKMLNSPHKYESILQQLSTPEINRPDLIECFF